MTPRQQAIVRFITEYVAEHRFPPTVRQIGEAVGLSSSASVHYQLATLHRLGVIQKIPGSPRTIAIKSPRAVETGETAGDVAGVPFPPESPASPVGTA